MICIRPVRWQAAWRTAACIAIALATACSGNDRKATPSATVPTAPAQTTTTDPYAVPAVIDAAYVNRVLAGLDAASGEVTRLVLSTRAIPPEAIERLKALYSDAAALQLSLDSYQEMLRSNFAGLKPTPGNVHTQTEQLLSVNSNCIFAQVIRDYSATAVRSVPPTPEWVALRPKGSSDPSHYNPTPWSFIYEGFERNGGPPSNPCARP